jgi:urease accessory protein
MGAPAARIGRDDFLTPPELRAWRLAESEAGRVGGVRVSLIERAGETRLGTCYQQVPLRVLPPFSFGPGRPALLYLLNPTAGLLDGDAQLVTLDAGPGTRTLVVGQSATRIHPCLKGFATQQWDVRVAAGATLVVLPGPAIPFAGCRYYQRVTVELEEGAGFVWGDVWLPGRYARGDASEQFQFETVVQELTVRRQGRLAFRDRFCWRGPWDEATATWHFGDGLACGSLFATGTIAEGLVESQTAWFPTAAGDTCLRWCGSSEAVTSAVVQAALRLAPSCRRGSSAVPWLSPTDLAPAHWFSVGCRDHAEAARTLQSNPPKREGGPNHDQ